MRAATAALVAALLALPAAAQADTVKIGANGNPFTGGLAFVPDKPTAKVGDVLAVTNNDFLVPHTFTERHNLWDLTGGYGSTGLTPPGFGPGVTDERLADAGTAQFFCRVHPTQMTGTLSVPVTLTLSSKRVRSHGRTRVRRYITATWAAVPSPAGEGFDVEIARGDEQPRMLLDGTTKTSVTIAARAKGTVTHVRARLRSLEQASRAEDFSPDASVVSDQR